MFVALQSEIESTRVTPGLCWSVTVTGPANGGVRATCRKVTLNRMTDGAVTLKSALKSPSLQRRRTLGEPVHAVNVCI